MLTRSMLSLLVLAAIAGTAHAQSAEAETAFRQGKKLMDEKKYAEACEAFDTSQRLAPVVTTKMNLANCREKNGEYATAWGLFLEIAIELKGDKTNAAMLDVAKGRAAKLEPRVSYLTISVPDESRVAGLVITRNGKEIDEGLWNRAMPIDGGSYEIAASAPGHEQWSTKIEIPLEQGSATVDVPKFKAIIVVPEDEPAPDDQPEDDPILETRPGATFTGQRKAAIGVGAIGVAALVAGGVLGVTAKGFHDDARALCPGNPCEEFEAANELESRATSRALFANISYGVGAVAVIGAAILWLTGAPDAIVVTEDGVAVAGRF